MAVTQMYEMCRALTSRVPLKEGERHCYFCDGFGGLPMRSDETRFFPKRCGDCEGTGKKTLDKAPGAR